jgi:DHA1 family tetracycline resistance protein-like MFS transporter
LVSLGSLAAIIAPVLFTWLFTTFTGPAAPVYFPGAAYVGASVICLAALGLDLVLGARRSSTKTEKAAA